MAAFHSPLERHLVGVLQIAPHGDAVGQPRHLDQMCIRDRLCPVCRSGSRDKSTICVVEEPKDVFALERAGEYNGQYLSLIHI